VTTDPAKEESRMAGAANRWWKAAEIPAESTTLDNGLRVIAHRDSKAPIAAVFVAYHAGSARESRGKTALAHLAEHLMFCGSEHAPGSYFLPLERAGASSINAHVREDYTGCFEAVPTGALDLALWMEAERMGWLVGALDAEKFEAQRHVVRQELIERESQSYGLVPRLLAEHSWPPEHPYSHPVNGLREDLDNLSLEDARQWVRTCFAPTNATLVIAGDVEPADAIERARRYFSDVPPGVALKPLQVPPPAEKAALRSRVVECCAPAARIYRVWNVPQYAASQCRALELACETLSGGVGSVLWRALVEEDRLAIELGGEFRGRSLGSQVVIWVTAAQGRDPRAVDAAFERELSRFLADGPGDADLGAARMRILARFLRGIERMCGPGSCAEALAEASVIAAMPGFHAARLRIVESLTREQTIETARRWLGTPSLRLELRPPREGASPKP